MAAKNNLGKQWDAFGKRPNRSFYVSTRNKINDEARLIPRKYHDMVWEGSLEPDLDKEYVRTTGEPELRAGHWHFEKDSSGTTRKYVASGQCRGRHDCPNDTQKVRNDLAQEFFMIDAARTNAK